MSEKEEFQAEYTCYNCGRTFNNEDEWLKHECSPVFATGILRLISDWCCPGCGAMNLAVPEASQVWCICCKKNFHHRTINPRRIQCPE